jgi:hypothetical protein
MAAVNVMNTAVKIIVEKIFSQRVDYMQKKSIFAARKF